MATTFEGCLCGCVRSDEAAAARRARAAAEQHERDINHTAFDLFYEDRQAGRTLMAPADYIAIARGS